MPQDQQKPVILFVHGAWHQPKHYSLLIASIEKQGFTVIAPTLASAGYDDSIDGKVLDDDVRAIQDKIVPYIDDGRNIIAVGHSYGAVPLQVAINGYTQAEREQKAKKGGFVSVIFIAPTPVLQKDISMYDSVGGQYTSAWFHDVSDTRLPLKNERLIEAFFTDVDKSVADDIIPTLCHQSKSPFEVSVPCTPADLSIRKILVLCKDDPIFTKDILTFVADKWGATVLEIESGHSPHLSETHRQWIANLVATEAEKA